MKSGKTWIDRKAMAAAAGVSVRTLFNYKNAGTVTAWRVTGKNRIEFNASKVLTEIAKHTGKASAPAQPKASAQPKKEKPRPVTDSQQNEVRELRKTIAHLEARIAKLEQAPAPEAPARNVTIVQPRQLPVTDEPKATGGEWLADMEKIRLEREEYLKNRPKSKEEIQKEKDRLKIPKWMAAD